MLNGTGKVAVIVVGSAAKVAWGTTKFVARDVAAPVVKSLVKPLVVHAAPAAAKFALKESAKHLVSPEVVMFDGVPMIVLELDKGRPL